MNLMTPIGDEMNLMTPQRVNEALVSIIENILDKKGAFDDFCISRTFHGLETLVSFDLVFTGRGKYDAILRVDMDDKVNFNPSSKDEIVKLILERIKEKITFEYRSIEASLKVIERLMQEKSHGY